MNTFKKTVLPNGIRLITAPLHESQTATIIVMFGAGSRYETPETNGMAHFLEHMFFQGTEKRPEDVDITKALDSLGAEFNAFTGKDHTGYYVKVAHQKLPVAIDVLSDMLLHSKFDPTELEKEKGVIVEEINMYDDNPMMKIHDVFETEMFKGNPLGWEIAGSRETVRAMTRENLVAYKDSHYRGDNCVIVVAGHLPQDVHEQVLASFATLPGAASEYTYPPKFVFPLFEGAFDAPRVSLVHRPSEQAQVILGFPAFSSFDKDETVGHVLATLLGGTMSSRLFVAIREKQSLAYSVHASLSAYQDTGYFAVQSGLDKTRLQAAIKAIREELEKVVNEGVDEEELQRAKDYLMGKISIRLENTSSLAQWYAEQETLTNQSLTPEEKFARVRAVTREDIQRVAKQIFDFKKSTLAIIGPYNDANEFAALLA
jgi:predicted Zn-dependent peptidase